jgi:hypothetical protein
MFNPPSQGNYMTNMQIILLIALLMLVAVGVGLYLTSLFFWKEYERKRDEVSRLKGRIEDSIQQGTSIARKQK